MREITLICVGKLKEKFLISACEEYIKRLGAYTRMEVIEVPEARIDQNPSRAQIDKELEDEARLIEQKIPKNAKIVAMCIEGKGCSSTEFSKRIFDMGVEGTSKLCFIIGGSNGLSPRIKSQAEWKLSMSEMTFPHHLARVMLLEQIYRAFQIGTGGSYHK